MPVNHGAYLHLVMILDSSGTLRDRVWMIYPKGGLALRTAFY